MKALNIAIMLALLFLVTGCMKLRMGDKNISFYSLEYDPPRLESVSSLPAVIRIERFRVFPLYDSTKMIYREKAFKRDAYIFHKWWASPPDLVSYFLARDFRQSGRFKAVFSPDQSLPASHLIDGMIEEFFEEDDENSWQAVLSLNISLIKEKEPDLSKRILMQKKYAIKVACLEKTPLAFAQAMSRAMANISEQIIRDSCEVISASTP
jgi:cholesterol transport system auxiliary component